MRISDWSSDVCSSDFPGDVPAGADAGDDDVDRRVAEILEDLARGGAGVDFDIGRVLELLRHPATVCRLALFFSFRPLKTNVGPKMLIAVLIYRTATVPFVLSPSMTPRPLSLAPAAPSVM